MSRSIFYYFGIALLALCPAAKATTFHFDTAPFAGTNVTSIPGRQIVGGEQFISFSSATDIFSINAGVFGVGAHVNFVNGPAGAIPGDANVVVLETFDNDNNPGTPFGAGQAADLIASRVTAHEAGFFIYFNQSLNLPRLVYSTDLASNTADLQILARMLNLTGAEGQNAMPNITTRNFDITTTPEPSSISMLASFLLASGGFVGVRRIRRGKTQA